MTTATLPPGYVALGTIAAHVSLIRKHTSDLDRFLKLQPIVARYAGIPLDEAGFSALEAVITEAGYDPEDYIEVAVESAKLDLVLAEQARSASQ